MGRLRDKVDRKLLGESSVASALPAVCALKQKCSSCYSNGYLLSSSGAFVKANLCSCVKSCTSCYGSCDLFNGGTFKSCRQPKPSLIVSAFNGAEIPARYKDADFACFNNMTGNWRQSLDALQKWSKSFKPKGGPGLIFSGKLGAGKTFVLATLAKLFCQRGLRVKFIDYPRLLLILKSSYGGSRTEEDILAPLYEADVLIIDELGKGKGTDWEMEKLEQLVLGRYNQDKTIVASTSFSLEKNVTKDSDNRYQSFEMEAVKTLSGSEFEQRIGSRVYSRLKESSLFLTFKGDDYREMQRSKRG